MQNVVRPSRLNRLGFLAWAWATLLVVLVSAAPDGGAPGSRAVGSAFDPATVSLTVGAQQPRAVAAARSEEYAPPAMPSGAAGMLPAAAFELASSSAATGDALVSQPPDRAGDPRSLTRAHGARAPPTA